MNIKDVLTQKLFDELPLIKGDLNLKYFLSDHIRNKDLSHIVKQCNDIYKRILVGFLDKEKHEYESMIFYCPQYKVYHDIETSTILIIIVTPVGTCGLVEVTNVINQKSKRIKNKCLS